MRGLENAPWRFSVDICPEVRLELTLQFPNMNAEAMGKSFFLGLSFLIYSMGVRVRRDYVKGLVEFSNFS